MKLTFLGTGSAMPTGERFQTGLLLSAGDDRLLVDVGGQKFPGVAGLAPVGVQAGLEIELCHAPS